MNRIVWIGTSKDDVRDFPVNARREAGFQLDKVQHGEEPDDWKPISAIVQAFARSGYGNRQAPSASSTSFASPMRFMYCTPSRRKLRGRVQAISNGRRSV
jgi:hypothetical protein